MITHKYWQCPLKSDPWQRYSPRHIFFQTDAIEKGANAVGMSMSLPATTESGDPERSSRLQLYKALFCMGREGGYNAAKGLSSRDITQIFITHDSLIF